MALGLHWEWRGFGQVARPLHGQITALPALTDSGSELTDHYLWSPKARVNVKLREQDLKLKRFVADDAGLERWLEDPAEVYAFPLAPSTTQTLEAALGSRLEVDSQEPLPLAALLAALQIADPPVHIISVAKSRSLRRLPLDHSYAPDEPLIVELTDILRPERISTVALEHPLRAAVQQGLVFLDLPASGLVPMNYMQALAVWAHGGRLQP